MTRGHIKLVAVVLVVLVALTGARGKSGGRNGGDGGGGGCSSSSDSDKGSGSTGGHRDRYDDNSTTGNSSGGHSTNRKRSARVTTVRCADAQHREAVVRVTRGVVGREYTVRVTFKDAAGQKVDKVSLDVTLDRTTQTFRVPMSSPGDRAQVRGCAASLSTLGL